MQKTLNILIADDDEGDRKQLKRVLKEAGLPCACTETASIDEALRAGEKCSFDCALIDYRLPGQDGLSGISALRERLPYMAIIMITAHGDENVATEAMKRGASDYMPKTRIQAQSMKRSIENAVEKAALLRTVAQQRNDLEVFSRVLVHDLTSPIHSVLGFSALIEESLQAGRPEEITAYCGPIVRALQRMGALIDTLHKYTLADEPVTLEPLEMRNVMLDALSNLETQIQQRGARVTYGELPAVLGTPQLVQLLQNLIGNAIKYCEAKVPCVQFTATPEEGNVWLFSLRDNGIGIPEKQYRQVFEPFNRLHVDSKYEGTGLGLATCKKILERHGGSIWCESKEGEGTTFFFTLHGVPPTPSLLPV